VPVAKALAFQVASYVRERHNGLLPLQTTGFREVGFRGSWLCHVGTADRLSLAETVLQCAQRSFVITTLLVVHVSFDCNSGKAPLRPNELALYQNELLVGTKELLVSTTSWAHYDET
jgi:hypothetical protein